MKPQLICHSVYLMGSILAGATIITQADGRSTSVVATGGTLERGRMGKLLGTRPDHVRDGVANSNPEPSQMEEGYHPILSNAHPLPNLNGHPTPVHISQRS